MTVAELTKPQVVKTPSHTKSAYRTPSIQTAKTKTTPKSVESQRSTTSQNEAGSTRSSSSAKATRSNTPVGARNEAQGKKNYELGKRGEEAAARFLDKRGYEILERNWCCFAGEADIIAKDQGNIVFVEVKTRKDCNKGFPAEAVNKQKRERYEKIALAYLQDNDLSELTVRFDVVSIVVVASDRALIRHHINAFAVA